MALCRTKKEEPKADYMNFIERLKEHRPKQPEQTVELSVRWGGEPLVLPIDTLPNSGSRVRLCIRTSFHPSKEPASYVINLQNNPGRIDVCSIGGSNHHSVTIGNEKMNDTPVSIPHDRPVHIHGMNYDGRGPADLEFTLTSVVIDGELPVDALVFTCCG